MDSRHQDPMSMMMGGGRQDMTDPKTMLWQFCQRFCKRNIAKTDIQYNSAKVHPNGTQATVKLLCLQGQEFAGEICANTSEAEKSAAQQALQFYGAEALPMVRPQAPQMPNMAGLAPQQLLAMSGMSGMPGGGGLGGGQGRPANVPLQGGQGGFGQAPFHMMGGPGGVPAHFAGAAPAAFTMPQSAHQPQHQQQQRENRMGGGNKGGSKGGDRGGAPKGAGGGKGGGGKGGKGGGGKGGQDGMRPGGNKGGGGGKGDRQAPGPKVAQPKAAAAAPQVKGEAADGESMETSKSQLNVACMKLLKRPMQKGEIVYDSPQTSGGFQSILRLPCLPDAWGTKQWTGKVCMSRKAAEQDAAEKALNEIKAAPEFTAVLASEGPTSKPAKKKGDGESKPEGKGKGKGKGKKGMMPWLWDWGAFLGKGGADLPREPVGEALVQGQVLEWKGNFGWIKTAEGAIQHEAAGRRDGKVYVNKADLQGGAESLEAGQTVKFKVYVDSSGLGASEVVVA